MWRRSGRAGTGGSRPRPRGRAGPRHLHSAARPRAGGRCGARRSLSISFSISACLDLFPMRLKLDSILHSSLRRLHREQLVKGSCTTSQRNYSRGDKIETFEMDETVLLRRNSCYGGLFLLIVSLGAETHLLLSALIAGSLVVGLALLLGVLAGVVIQATLGTALESAGHSVGAPLPLSTAVGGPGEAADAHGTSGTQRSRGPDPDERGSFHAAAGSRLREWIGGRRTAAESRDRGGSRDVGRTGEARTTSIIFFFLLLTTGRSRDCFE